MKRLQLALVALLLMTGPAGQLWGQTLPPQVATIDEAIDGAIDAGTAELGRHMQITRLMGQLRQEGLDGAGSLAKQFEIESTSAIAVQMERLFDSAAMEALFLSELQRSLATDPDTLRVASAFFATSLGQKAVSAEITARQSVQTDAGKAAAKAAYDALSRDDIPRREVIDRLIVEGDLVEFNVMGGLNANFAFVRGLAQTGALGEMPEQDMLAMVWDNEKSLRAESADWLAGFMTIAYSDLTLPELQTYRDFLTSPDGKKLNGALFAAFDRLYRGLSEQQGRIIGDLMQGEDI